MGRTKTKAQQKSIQRQHNLKIAAFLSAVVGGAAVMQYISPHLIKTPMYDSKLSGEDWVQELLNGHPGRFYDNLGMSKHVFRKLVQELQIYAGLDDSKHITRCDTVSTCAEQHFPLQTVTSILDLFSNRFFLKIVIYNLKRQK